MQIASRGFSFIELMVSAAMLGVLAMVAVPMLELTAQRAKEQELRTALREIRTAIDDYKQAWDDGKIEHLLGESGYPHRLEDLVAGVPDASDPLKKKFIYFLRRIPADPMAETPANKPEMTWGKRSYESSHDHPKEGRDVFDVYSLSQRVGLNGIKYNEW